MVNLTKVCHSHDQVIPSASWVVTHDLGDRNVTVDVFIDRPEGLTKIIPRACHPSTSNTVNIEFTNEESGVARVFR
jgi:hypothetical protein